MPLLEPWLRTHRQKKFLGIYNRKVFNYFTNPYNKQGSETHNSFLVAAHIKIIQYCKDAISDVEKPPIRIIFFFSNSGCLGYSFIHTSFSRGLYF